MEGTDLASYVRQQALDNTVLYACLLYTSPGEGGDMIDWVIGVPSPAERKVLLESFERAIQAAACIIEHGCQKAMNDFN